MAHYIHKRSSGSNGLMALKLDISKAYDHVEWKFLEAMMHRMGYLTGGFVQLCCALLW